MNVTTLSRATLIVCGIVIVVIPGAESYDTYSVNDDSTSGFPAQSTSVWT